MKFIEVYATNDKLEFYKAAEYLEAHNIEFQKLHEYRLYAEYNFYARGAPAILRALEKDASAVYQLLIDGGFIENTFQQKSQNTLKETSFLDTEMFQSEIQKIKGKKIEKVIYVFSNEVDFDRDTYHSVDFAIGIQLENESYLAWNFEEEDVDFERDLHLPNRYDLKFHNILKELSRPFKVKDVSRNKHWNELVGKPIKDIKIYSQAFRTNKIVTDLVIETESKSIAIYSSEEPSAEEEKVDLSISNQWTIVVFDEATISESGRIEK